jgi:dienelactone hydrolase
VSTSGRGETPPPYTEFFYQHDGLRLQSYLFKPATVGPFPLVIYNHGLRFGSERAQRPFLYVGSLLTEAGYAALVLERRGYGASDGPTFREEVGGDYRDRFVARVVAETGDALAAVDAMDGAPDIDTSKIAMMGWSFGALVSVFAAARTDRLFAVINQAGGSLNFLRSSPLRDALEDAARALATPIYCMVAKNDGTVDAARRVHTIAASRGIPAELTVYPAFTPSQPIEGIAPGHLIFGAEGLPIWGRDVVRFLDTHRPK